MRTRSKRLSLGILKKIQSLTPPVLPELPMSTWLPALPEQLETMILAAIDDDTRPTRQLFRNWIRNHAAHFKIDDRPKRGNE